MLIERKVGCSNKTYYCKYEEFQTLPLDGITDCSMVYIKDWKELSEDVQTTLVSRIQMFDTEEQRWIPQ